MDFRRTKGQLRYAVWIVLMTSAIASGGASLFGISVPADAAIDVARSSDHFVITKIHPGSEVWYFETAIGDRVTQINDMDAAQYSEWPSDIESIEISHATDGSTDRIVIGSGTTNLVQQTITLLLLGSAFSIMSLFLITRADRSVEVVLFAFFASVAGANLAIAPASIAAHSWARLIQGALTATMAIYMIAFFAVFARGITDRSRYSFRNLPEISTAVAFLLILAWILVATASPDLFGVVRNTTVMLLVLSLAAVLIWLPFRYRSANQDRRDQLRLATLGTLLGLFPFLFLSVIPLEITGTHIIAPEVSVLTIVLLPLSFGYSILRYQLLDISRLVHRSATYALITAAIIAVYGSVLTLLNLFTDDSDLRRNIELVLLFAMFAGIPLISSIRNRAIGIADRLLYPHSIDRESLVDALSAPSSEPGTPSDLVGHFVSTVGQGLGLRYAFATADSSTHDSLSEYGIRPAGLWPHDIVDDSNDDIGISRLTRGEDGTEYLISTTQGINGESAKIVLGPRIDGASFDGEDLRLLHLSTNMLTNELARTQLSEEVRTQQEQLASIDSEVEQIQQYERAEISSYLHDEPLQKIAYTLGQMRERALPEDLAGLLEEVADDLRTTSASLSPDILKSSGLVVAITLAIEEQGNRSDFQIFSELDSVDPDTRFSEEVELAIYRTVQEGLNNVRKHAEARAVWVQLSYEAGTISASVDDNGVGISDSDDEPKNPGQNLGLRGLERRVNQLGGTLTISPRPSRGTSLVVRIPAETVI